MDTRVKPAYDAVARGSIVLQQPLDVVELELRTKAFAEPAAQFLENAAHALHVHFAGDFYRQVVKLVAAQRTAQWIAVAARALLAAGAVAWSVVLAVAIARLHLLRKIL